MTPPEIIGKSVAQLKEMGAKELYKFDGGEMRKTEMDYESTYDKVERDEMFRSQLH